MARPAPHERGVDVRIWLPRRVLAPVAAVWRHKLPVTVFGVARALARNPEAVAAMREAGWEIATHGLKWIDYKDAPAPKNAPI